MLSKLKVLSRPVTVVWYCRHPSGALHEQDGQYEGFFALRKLYKKLFFSLNFEPVVIGAFDLGDLDVKLPGGGVGGVEHEGQGGSVGGVKIDCRWSGGGK